MEDNRIKVVCRLRPINQIEMQQGGQCCVEHTTKEISIKTSNEKCDFTFDRVFGSETEQKDVYDEVAKPILESIMNGYNGTIFAYGQTSSGKTHTMEGPDNPTEETKGLIPRIMTEIFDYIGQSDVDKVYIISVSFLEIYNEKVNDLLDSSKTNLNIKEDRVRGVYVQNLTEERVESAQEMKEVMVRGSNNRTIASTKMNDRSSRSHSLFCIFINVKDIKSDSCQTSKLYFVDLAGSEKIAKTNVSGQQLEEAKNINKSLTCLGMVINALASDKKEHVPYRDSKLTRILSESIGGNSKTTLLLACSMCSYNDKETLGTLRFGARAKKIKNKPKINVQKNAKELQALLDIAEQKIQDQETLIYNLQQSLIEERNKVNISDIISTDIQSEVKQHQYKKTQNSNSIKLLQQYHELLNMKEEKEQLQTELASRELMFQNRIDESNEVLKKEKNYINQKKIKKLKIDNENMKNSFAESLKKQQRILLDNESLKSQIQEKDMIHLEYKKSLDAIKIDLKYLLMSLQIKQYPNISDTDSTKSIFTTQDVEHNEEKAVQNLILFKEKLSKMDSIFDQDYNKKFKIYNQSQDITMFDQKDPLKITQFEQLTLSQIGKQDDQTTFLKLLESENVSVEYLDEEIIREDSSLKNDQYEDIKEESDLQKILVSLCDQYVDSENIQIIQNLFYSQRKKISELVEKTSDLYDKLKNSEEKNINLTKKIKEKLIRIKIKYNQNNQENQKVRQELQKELEETAFQFAEFKQQQMHSVEALQAQIRILTNQLDFQQRQSQNTAPNFDKSNPLSREFQMECTIKQMMQERKEIYEQLQQVRLDNETLQSKLLSSQDQYYVLEKDYNKLNIKYQELASTEQGSIFRRQPRRGQSIEYDYNSQSSASQGQNFNLNAKTNDVRYDESKSRSSSQNNIKQITTSRISQTTTPITNNRRSTSQSQTSPQPNDFGSRPLKQSQDSNLVYGSRSPVHRQSNEGSRQNTPVLKKFIFGYKQNIDGQLAGISSIVETVDEGFNDSGSSGSIQPSGRGPSLISMIFKKFF